MVKNMRTSAEALGSGFNWITKGDRLSVVNRQYLEEYFTHLVAERRDPQTIIQHEKGLSVLLEGLHYPEDLKKTMKKDIEQAAAYMNGLTVISGAHKGNRIAESSRNRWIAIWKVFYKWLLGTDIAPDCIRWLKESHKEQSKLLPEYLLTEEEVVKMISACKTLRDKAIVSLLYETGVRAGELLSLEKRFVDLSSTPAHITVTGKTGMRRIPIIACVPYLTNYLNTEKDLRDNDIIWRSERTNKPLDYDTLREQIPKIAKRAGVTKRVHVHAYRKARATHLASRLNDQVLKKFFGWTPNSGMASVYISLSGREIDDAYSGAYGLIPEKQKEPLIKTKACPRCQYSNGVESVYCGRCGTPLTTENALAYEQNKKIGEEALGDYIQNPTTLRELAKAYKQLLSAVKKGKIDYA